MDSGPMTLEDGWSSIQRSRGYRLQSSGSLSSMAAPCTESSWSWRSVVSFRRSIAAMAVLSFLVLTTSLTFVTIAAAKYAIGTSRTRGSLTAAASEDVSETQHYHRRRLLVTLHSKPQQDATASTVLPGPLELNEVIDNSPAGSNSSAGAQPDDLIYVGNVPEGQDAADYLAETLAHERVKHVELDALLFTHAAETTRAAGVQPNDQFFKCDGNGQCGSSSRVAAGGGGQQWGLRQISAPQAWDITKGSKSVKVGVIDTGISLKHQDLQANVNKKCEDFANNDHNCDEGSMTGGSKGHGTFLAGIIAATTDNSKGIAGVAWHTDVIGCTMFSDHCRSAKCAGSTSAAIKCLNWLRNEQGVRIVANSYGCSVQRVNFCYSVQFEKAIAAFNAQGGLFIVSAGNDGTNNDKVKHYPAGYDVENVLTMTATGITKGSVFWDTSKPEHLTKFSNYGSQSVDLAAPGQDIISTWAPASSMCEGDAECYARISGTSAAVPYAAGAAALISSLPNAPKNGAAIKKILMDTADRLPFLSGRVKSGARLNVYKALLAVSGGAKAIPGKAKARRLKRESTTATHGTSKGRKSNKKSITKSRGKSQGRRLMEGVRIRGDDSSESALSLQLAWEAQQRNQLLGPSTASDRNVSGLSEQPLQQLLPTLEQQHQPGASLARGVDWMQRMVAGDRGDAPSLILQHSQLPHKPQRQRLPTL